MKNLLHDFLTALIFYTRIQAPIKIDYQPSRLNRATKYLPIIGLLIGLICALIWYLSSLIVNNNSAIVIAIIASVFLTGAFHEDGFADSCDGLGGGWTVNDKLTIMKDSRVGSYALVGMILLMLLKFTLLVDVAVEYLTAAIISMHVVSRLTPVFLIAWLPYVREDESSKVRPVSKGIAIGDVLIAALLTFVSLLCFVGLFGAGFQLLLLPLSAVFTAFGLKLFYQRQIGGYTGDLLGAAQQISEVLTLVFFSMLWHSFA